MTFREMYSPEELSKYESFVQELTKATEQATVTILGKVYDQFNFYRIDVNPKGKKTMLIGATIHGDEESGAYGVVEYLKNFDPPEDLHLIVLPLMNPHGFVKKVRGNGNNIDLNRAFRAKEVPGEPKITKDTLTEESIDFLLSLHEDGGAEGFYAYYPEGKPLSHLKPLMKAVEKHFPVMDVELYRQESMQNGVIVIREDNPRPHNVRSFEFWVRKQHDCHYLCTEVPTKFPLEQRVVAVAEIIDWSVTKLFPKICKKA